MELDLKMLVIPIGKRPCAEPYTDAPLIPVYLMRGKTASGTMVHWESDWAPDVKGEKFRLGEVTDIVLASSYFR